MASTNVGCIIAALYSNGCANVIPIIVSENTKQVVPRAKTIRIPNDLSLYGNWKYEMVHITMRESTYIGTKYNNNPSNPGNINKKNTITV